MLGVCNRCKDTTSVEYYLVKINDWLEEVTLCKNCAKIMIFDENFYGTESKDDLQD